ADHHDRRAGCGDAERRGAAANGSVTKPAIHPKPEARTMSNPAFKFDHVHIISENPRASAAWYVEMFGATIAADTVARGAPQIFVDLGGTTILIRGRRPGETPLAARPMRNYADYS